MQDRKIASHILVVVSLCSMKPCKISPSSFCLMFYCDKKGLESGPWLKSRAAELPTNHLIASALQSFHVRGGVNKLRHMNLLYILLTLPCPCKVCEPCELLIYSSVHFQSF